MKTRRVLVTGAGGFIGANLVRHLLAKDYDVIAVVRPRGSTWRLDRLRSAIRIETVDLSDWEASRSLLVRVRPDWIFHLAAFGAYSWQSERRRIYETNQLATVGLLEAAAAIELDAFITAGSSSEYGVKNHAPPEDETLEPNSDYAVSKAAATFATCLVARTLGMNAIVLRLYSAYGPWEDPNRLVPVLIAAALQGRLPVLADPTSARDFVYVDDVCQAFIAAAERAAEHRGQIYNVGSGIQTSLSEIVDTARSVFGIDAKPSWGTMASRKWDTDVWVANPDRARAELGWQAKTGLANGLQLFGDWLMSAGEHRSRYHLDGVAV